MKIIDNLNEFIEKVDNMKKVNPLDLSSDQDLSIAIMNLISIEEHLMFSGAKTQDTSFYDLIEPIREDRKEFLGMIIKSYKGEVWCISKHLLATCMRLMEVGTKALSAGKKDEAYNFFNKAYTMYTLFWGLNLNALNETEAKKVIKNLDPKTLENVKKDNEKSPKNKKNSKIEENNEEKTNTEEETKDRNNSENNAESSIEKLKGFISKAVNCCRE